MRTPLELEVLRFIVVKESGPVEKIQGLGPLEADALNVLWDSSGWLTPGEVHERLTKDRDLAYTTVMTVLVHLGEKGFAERRKDGRAFAYHAVQSREEHAASVMASTLKGARNKPMVLTNFVEQLDAKQRTQLRRMLAE